jgi:hypothetical protein
MELQIIIFIDITQTPAIMEEYDEYPDFIESF